MAELASARRAMAHGDTEGARRALDAALALDSKNVQALDWRAELERGSPQPAPPPVRPAPAAAGGWPAFEQRIRERRTRRRIEAARAALAAGDHATAREALEELASLAPTEPDVIALQRELSRAAGGAVREAPRPSPVASAKAESVPDVREKTSPESGPHILELGRPVHGPSDRLREVPRPSAAASAKADAVPHRPRVLASPDLTLTRPPSRSRWALLSAAAVLLAGIGGVLGYTAFNQTREASTLADTTHEQPSAPAQAESAPEAVAATSEPVSTAGVTAAELQEPPIADVAAPSDEPVAPNVKIEPDPAEQPPTSVTTVQRAASSGTAAPATGSSQNSARTLPTDAPRTLPGREYPASTIDMSARTQLDVPSPSARSAVAPPQDTVVEASAAPLRDAIGTRTVQEDPTPAGSTTLAPSSTANAASASTSSSATVPPPPRESAVAPAVERVDSTASVEASVRQLLDRYVRAYNRLDASAAHAIWPGVNKGALERAFAELSAQTLRFDRCTVSVDQEGGTASCSGDARWVPRVGDQGSRRERRTWKFELARNGDEWIITRAEARR